MLDVTLSDALSQNAMQTSVILFGDSVEEYRKFKPAFSRIMKVSGGARAVNRRHSTSSVARPLMRPTDVALVIFKRIAGGVLESSHQMDLKRNLFG